LKISKSIARATSAAWRGVSLVSFPRGRAATHRRAGRRARACVGAAWSGRVESTAYGRRCLGDGAPRRRQLRRAAPVPRACSWPEHLDLARPGFWIAGAGRVAITSPLPCGGFWAETPVLLRRIVAGNGWRW